MPFNVLRWLGAASLAPNNAKSAGVVDAANPNQGPLPVTTYSSAGVEQNPAAPVLAAGTAHVGNVGGEGDLVKQTLVLDTNIYAAGDVLTVPVAVALARAADRTLVLESLVVIDEDDQGIGFDIYFFDNASAALGTINAAVSISDADARSILGRVQIAAGDFTDLGGVRAAFKTNLGILLKPVSGTANVMVGCVAQGAGTYTASGMRVNYGVLQN